MLSFLYSTFINKIISGLVTSPFKIDHLIANHAASWTPATSPDMDGMEDYILMLKFSCRSKLVVVVAQQELSQMGLREGKTRISTQLHLIKVAAAHGG